MGERRTYPTDLTDEQWHIVAPRVPPEKRGGRHRTVNMREVVNAILYILRTGCQWRNLPHDFPPWGTVSWYFWLWSNDGTWTRIHDKLRERDGPGGGGEKERAQRGDHGQPVGQDYRAGRTKRIRCGKEDDREEEAPARRYDGPDPARDRPSRRHPGQGWCTTTPGDARRWSSSLLEASAGMGRRRVRRPAHRVGGTTVRFETPARDRSQDGGTQFQRGEEEVDSRANVRVAGALQTVIEGLRGSDEDERELDPNGDDRRHDKTSDSRCVPADLMASKQASSVNF